MIIAKTNHELIDQDFQRLTIRVQLKPRLRFKPRPLVEKPHI